jgi:hypothetical protein
VVALDFLSLLFLSPLPLYQLESRLACAERQVVEVVEAAEVVVAGGFGAPPISMLATSFTN